MEDLQLESLLYEFSVPEIFQELRDNGVRYESLRYLTKEDLNDVVKKNIGARVMFREKLLVWQKEQLEAEKIINCKWMSIPMSPCFRCEKCFYLFTVGGIWLGLGIRESCKN